MQYYKTFHTQHTQVLKFIGMICVNIIYIVDKHINFIN